MFTNRWLSSFGHKVQQGMSHMRLARLLLVCAVVFSAVASSQTAFAAEPQIFTYLDTGSNFSDCGSFIMREDYSIPTRVIVFASDPDGNAIYGQAHQDYSGTFTNLTTGYSLLATKNQTIIFDDRVGTHRVLGLQFSLIIPGEGVAILDAGNLTFTPDGVTFHGRNQLFDNGPDLICAALS